MKKVKNAIALAAIMLGMSTTAFAQDGLSIRVGGSFPVGAFAQGSAGDMALLTSASELGAAAIGYNAGLKYQYNLISGLSAFASADVFYNGLNEDAKNDLKGDNENITLPSYLNIPVMVGINYAFLNFEKVSLWAEAGAGVNIRHITTSTASAAVGTIVSGNTETMYNNSTSFAWQAGIGVSLSKFSLSAHYYGLGESTINGESTLSADLGGILSGTSEPAAFTAGKLSPSMVVARLSYTF